MGATLTVANKEMTFRLVAFFLKMATPIDIAASDSDYLSKSPLVSCETLNRFKDEDSAGVPLETPWTLWLDKAMQGCSASEYESNLKKIYTFSTIQGFWAVFNNVPNVDDMQVKYSYHLMRDERRPIWEEPYNQAGGTWRIRCEKRYTSQIWKELLLAAIGEQLSDSLEPGDEICGLTVSIRDKFDVVQLWNLNAQKADKAKDRIINKVTKLLPDVDFSAPLYKPHQTHYAYENSGQ